MTVVTARNGITRFGKRGVKAAEGIARVFFFARTGQRIVMLPQFVKKSPKTPPKEIEVARRRMKEMQNA